MDALLLRMTIEVPFSRLCYGVIISVKSHFRIVHITRTIEYAFQLLLGASFALMVESFRKLFVRSTKQ